MFNRMKAIRKRGFNLIEAAIVLGVVGLVIGGIWTAAAAMMESYKVNETVDGIISSVSNIQELISISDSAAIEASGESAPSIMMPVLIKAGVFPENWVELNGVFSPLGGYLYFNNHVGSFDFGITNSKIRKSSCVKVMTKISSIGAMAGSRGAGYFNRISLGYVYVSDGITSKYISTFPISPETAESSCFDSNHSLSFGFGYTRRNN